MRNSLYRISMAALLAGVAALMMLPRSSMAIAEANPASGTEVKIDNFSFTPATITIKAGTEIHWTNRDDIPHTVVSTDQVFKSKVLDTDQDFSYTFAKPGTYTYFCSLHPKMTAKVIVQ